jgi:hypothetical protein
LQTYSCITFYTCTANSACLIRRHSTYQTPITLLYFGIGYQDKSVSDTKTMPWHNFLPGSKAVLSRLTAVIHGSHSRPNKYAPGCMVLMHTCSSKP